MEPPLDAHQLKFLRALPARAESVRRRLDALNRDRSELPALHEELREIIGSGWTLGFDGLVLSARALERRLREVRQDPDALEASGQGREAKALYAAVSELARTYLDPPRHTLPSPKLHAAAERGSAVLETERLLQGLVDLVREPLARLRGLGAAPSPEEVPLLASSIEDALLASLDLVRAPATVRRRQSLKPAFERIVETSVERGADVGLTLRASAEVSDAPDVDVDANVFATIVEELVANAIDAGARRLTITVDFERRSGERTLRTVVADDGPGVPNHLRETVFEPFFSTRQRRIGLGLTKARRLATAAGGDLFLGQAVLGSELVLRLPA